MRNLKYFWKLSVLMVSRYSGEYLRTKLSPKNFSLRPLNVNNTQNLFKIVQKWPFLTSAVLVAKFWNENDCQLDKNLKLFFLPKVTISNSFKDIDV